MTGKETTNIIIKLSEMGHTNQEINEFLGFIETHIPSEQEAKEAVGYYSVETRTCCAAATG